MSRKTELRADLLRGSHLTREGGSARSTRSLESCWARWQRELQEHGSVRMIAGTRMHDHEMCIRLKLLERWQQCRAPERYWNPVDSVIS